VHAQFNELFAHLESGLRGGERLTAYLSAETSDFVRFNQGRIRQPGSVRQASCSLTLTMDQRQANIHLSLTGNPDDDAQRASAAVQRLRDWLPFIPKDPHLMAPDVVSSSVSSAESRLPDATQMVTDILEEGGSEDLVGILATGSMTRGFASSTGQRNWYTAHPFSLDWCQYSHGDKAVKTTYSGFDWQRGALADRIRTARARQEILSRPPRSLPPGAYRTYLTPTALTSVISMCCWGGFSARATQIGMTPLLHLSKGDKTLDPRISVAENIADGVAEDFQGAGFRRSAHLQLIADGVLANTLVSPRSAAEYGLQTNGASQSESPSSLDMLGGEMPTSEALSRLGTGVYISNLWYLNFSDRAAGRFTGMTRFATLWVEDGQPVAPINPMRFDETIYNILGKSLVSLTKEREFSLSTSTYHQRSTNSTRLPGALLDTFPFTL
jgi:predicted Zn-dependent protease